MILGIGTDLANIDRIQGTLDRYVEAFRRITGFEPVL